MSNSDGQYPEQVAQLEAKLAEQLGGAGTAGAGDAQGGNPPAAEQDLQHKYDTLAGGYKHLNQELASARAANDELQRKLDTTNDLLAQLAQPLPTAMPPQFGAPYAPQQPMHTSLPQQLPLQLTEEEKEYEDVVPLVQKVSNAQVAPLQAQIMELNQKLAQLQATAPNVMGVEQQLFTMQRQATVNNAKMQLSQVLPNWEAIDQDVAFTAWLNTPDPVYGVTPRASMDAALNNGDAQRIVNTYIRYAQQHGGAALGGNVPPQNLSPSQIAANQLQQQIVPGRPRQQVGGGDPTVVRMSDFTKLTNDYAKGVISKETYDAARVDMEKAIREGRFVR